MRAPLPALGSAAVIAFSVVLAIFAPRPSQAPIVAAPIIIVPKSIVRVPLPSMDEPLRQIGIAALRSALRDNLAPRVVKTEAITPDQPPQQQVIPDVLPTPRPQVQSQPQERDICQRHNMRKVYIGRTWRCRK